MMISAMRSKAMKVVTYFFVILLILGFIAWGVSDVLPTGGFNPRVAATVGDVEITPDEVEQRYRNQTNQLRNLLGSAFDAERAKALGLADSVLNGMIDETLYIQGAKRLGLVVTDEQIRNHIHNDETFKGPVGEFDRNRFHQILRSNDYTEGSYVRELRTELLREQLMQSIEANVNVPRTLMRELYNYREEKRLAAYVRVRASSIKNVPEPGETALERFYKDRTKQFTAPEFRAVTLVTLDADELAKEYSVAEKAINEYYEAHLDEYTTPERRTIKQMLFADEQKAKDAHTMLQTDRDFATVAKEAAGMDAGATDLGKVTRRSFSRELSAEAADAVFKLEKGRFSNPLKSALGWHIIKVEDIEAGSKKTLADVRDQIRQTLAKEKAIDGLFKLGNQLEDTLAAGASLEEAARQLNLKVRKIPAMDRSGRDPDGNRIENLPQQGDFLGTAFNAEEGLESQLIESGTDAYFIVRVDKITPPTLRPLASIRAEVVEAWKSERRMERAEKQAQTILDKLKGGTPLAAIAEARSLELQRTEPFTRSGRELKDRLPPALIEKLFSGLPGDTAMARGGGGYVVAQLKDIKSAEIAADKEEADALAAQLSQAMTGDLMTQLSSALRNELTVTVNKRAIENLYN